MNNFSPYNFQILSSLSKNHFPWEISCWSWKVSTTSKGLIQFHWHSQLNLKLQINLEKSLLIALAFSFLVIASKPAGQGYFFHLLLFKVCHLFHLFLARESLDMSFYADGNEQLTLGSEDVCELFYIRWDLEDRNIDHFYRLFRLKDTISFYWLAYPYLILMNFH